MIATITCGTGDSIYVISADATAANIDHWREEAHQEVDLLAAMAHGELAMRELVEATEALAKLKKERQWQKPEDKPFRRPPKKVRNTGRR